jgi:hypothetical protein
MYIQSTDVLPRFFVGCAELCAVSCPPGRLARSLRSLHAVPNSRRASRVEVVTSVDRAWLNPTMAPSAILSGVSSAPGTFQHCPFIPIQGPQASTVARRCPAPPLIITDHFVPPLPAGASIPLRHRQLALIFHFRGLAFVLHCTASTPCITHIP